MHDATHVNCWEPAVTYMSCMNPNFCFSYRIYPLETFEFLCSCIRGQWIQRQPTSEVPAAGLLADRAAIRRSEEPTTASLVLVTYPIVKYECVNVNVTIK